MKSLRLSCVGDSVCDSVNGYCYDTGVSVHFMYKIKHFFISEWVALFMRKETAVQLPCNIGGCSLVSSSLFGKERLVWE